VVRTLEAGKGFGELALQVPGGIRAATVRATELSECLVLSGFTYRKVLAKYHREDINNRVTCLPSQALTQSYPPCTHFFVRTMVVTCGFQHGYMVHSCSQR
jgi:hypothetical protein